MIRPRDMYSDRVMTEVGRPAHCWIQSMGAAKRPTPAKTRKKIQPGRQGGKAKTCQAQGPGRTSSLGFKEPRQQNLRRSGQQENSAWETRNQGKEAHTRKYREEIQPGKQGGKANSSQTSSHMGAGRDHTGHALQLCDGQGGVFSRPLLDPVDGGE